MKSWRFGGGQTSKEAGEELKQAREVGLENELMAAREWSRMRETSARRRQERKRRTRERRGAAPRGEYNAPA